MNEEPMSGGNASEFVVRVGDTVRKPWTRSTAAVHGLLRRLGERGIDVPAPLGRDAEGRQVLGWVEGTAAIDLPSFDVADLRRVGALVRAIHDASPPARQTAGADWDAALIPTADANLICHNDLAPWNLIVGERWVFIDWDAAGPSTRLWDLAYSAQSFADLTADEAVVEAARRLRALVDGYGADGSLRAALPAAITRRTRAMYELLLDADRTGRQPWARVFLEDGEHWRGAAEYVAAHEERWREVLQIAP